LVAQIARLLEAEARRRDVAVAFHGEADLPRVVADEAQVKQVLMNLLLNALQACGSHGTVEITTRSEEERGERWCTVTIADSGAGIPPEHVEQIFDPFFTTKDAGSGLGLFIARQIVTEHGGHISTAPRPGGATGRSWWRPAGARRSTAYRRERRSTSTPRPWHPTAPSPSRPSSTTRRCGCWQAPTRGRCCPVRSTRASPPWCSRCRRSPRALRSCRRSRRRWSRVSGAGSESERRAG